MLLFFEDRKRQKIPSIVVVGVFLEGNRCYNIARDDEPDPKEKHEWIW